MIIDRYVLREIGIPFVGVSAVLLAVFVSFSLSRLLAEAGAGLLGAAEVRELAMLKALIALEVLLPIALYVAVLVALGRMHRESEMHALLAGGIGQLRLLRPVVLFAALLALVVAVLSTQARPWAWDRIYALKREAEAFADVDRITAGEFHEYGSEARTLFIESIAEDRNELRGVFVHDQEAGTLQIISAPSARFIPYVSADRHELLLRDARVYRAVDGDPGMFGNFGSFLISLRAAKVKKALYKEKAQPTASLYDTGNPSGRAEFQWRLSTPISTLLLALAAVPLSETSPRQGRYGRLLLALLLYAFYYNLLGIARNWVEQHSMNTLWWAPLMLGVAVVFLYCYPVLRQRVGRRDVRS